MIPFTKMHGLGNDFIVIDRIHLGMIDVFDLSRRLCDRHTGVGADGVLLISPSDKADIRMRIINSDGSEAEMCGNGIRCAAKYAYDNAMVKDRNMKVETLAGIIQPKIILENGKVERISVDMGKPIFERHKIPMLGMGDKVMGETIDVGANVYRISVLRMGVPHAVLFVDDLDDINIAKVGRAIETHSIFPERINVNFVEVIDKNHIKLRTFERGAGLTLACGTGASASVIAGFNMGHIDRMVTVSLQLGKLKIEYAENGRVNMSGPAEYAFKGEFKK